MKPEQLLKLFAANLEALKQTLVKKSGFGIELKTGVYKATANKLLKGEHAATLETLAKIAEGFNVPPWALIHPDGLELHKDERLAGLIESFAACSDSGRDAICHSAELEARYSQHEDPPQSS